MIDTLAGAMYRMAPRHAPNLLLKRLGIATPPRRLEFYTLDRLMRGVETGGGAIIECGTYRGATLLGIAHILQLRGLDTPVFGLDSFEGFPEPSPKDALEDGTLHPVVHKGGLGDVSYEALVARIRLLGFQDRITLLKGYFEHTLPSLAGRRFALAHLDCDLYDSYMTCLEFLHPRMIDGGYMLFDDYGSPAYKGAERAVDEFFAGRPERLQYFPEAEGRRMFVRVGGGLAGGAHAVGAP